MLTDRLPSNFSRRQSRGSRLYDVAFYCPFVGLILSGSEMPPGGAETQILMLARGLANLGQRVALVVYDDGRKLPEQVDAVTIVARPPYKGQRRLVGKIQESFCIWYALWKAPADTVVYRCAGVELGMIALYTRFARRRLVYSSANVVDFEFHKIEPRRLNQLVFSLGVKLASRVVVQTAEQVELCRRAFAREPTVIQSICEPMSPQASAPEAFLWVGRLVSYKRPLDYLALARALPHAHFWMVGVDGEPELTQQVRSLADSIPNLELLTPRPRAQVQDLLARAVASVNTAEFEGMPNVLLEAWAQGVPALVLHHDPNGVIERHGVGGYAAGSSERFAALARELWESRLDRSDLAQRCRRYVAAAHAPGEVTRQWLQLLAADAVTSANTTGRAESTCAA